MGGLGIERPRKIARAPEAKIPPPRHHQILDIVPELAGDLQRVPKKFSFFAAGAFDFFSFCLKVLFIRWKQGNESRGLWEVRREGDNLQVILCSILASTESKVWAKRKKVTLQGTKFPRVGS